MKRFAWVPVVAGTLGCIENAEPAQTPPRAPAAAAAAPGDPTGNAGKFTWDAVQIEPQDVVLTSGGHTLKGIIVKPAGDGPFPALLWNHGSEETPAIPKRFTKYWIAQGWVVFMPVRRGHAGSTGEWIMANTKGMAREAVGRKVVAEMEKQVEDVGAGAAYLRSQRFVDPNKIVVAGCSFGGIATLLAAERPLGVRAGIDFAGGAMSWSGEEALRERMKIAARRAIIPIFYIQAENDFNTEPTRVLSEEARRANRPFQARIYPPNGTDKKDGHHLCIARADIWGGDVQAFLRPLLQ